MESLLYTGDLRIYLVVGGTRWYTCDIEVVFKLYNGHIV